MHSFYILKKCLNECLARAETAKLPFAKFAVPSAYYELALYNTNEKRYEDARNYLNKAQTFKDYELSDRLGVQIKSLEKRIKHYIEKNKA